MADDAAETARAHLVRVVAQTSIGDPAWTIGEDRAELIVMRLEALMEAKAIVMLPNGAEFFRGRAPMATADPTFGAIDLHGATVGQIDLKPGETIKQAYDRGERIEPLGLQLPDGFTPVTSVPTRGKLPPGLNHDTHVQVIYRDGRFNKPAGSGKRVEVGEASLFNWKHAGPGLTLVKVKADDGTEKAEQRQGMIGNPDDDIIGYRFVAPPENKMAMPKAVG